MSLALLFLYLMLNMFRMLIHPSSGACDLFVGLFHGLYCSVRIEVFAFCFRKRVSANIGCCGVLWLFFVCSMFLIMFPEYILMSCI